MNNSKDLGEKSNDIVIGSNESVQRREAALLATLTPRERSIVQQVMANTPGLSAAKALAMLEEAGL